MSWCDVTGNCLSAKENDDPNVRASKAVPGYRRLNINTGLSSMSIVQSKRSVRNISQRQECKLLQIRLFNMPSKDIFAA